MAWCFSQFSTVLGWRRLKRLDLVACPSFRDNFSQCHDVGHRFSSCRGCSPTADLRVATTPFVRPSELLFSKADCHVALAMRPITSGVLRLQESSTHHRFANIQSTHLPTITSDMDLRTCQSHRAKCYSPDRSCAFSFVLVDKLSSLRTSKPQRTVRWKLHDCLLLRSTISSSPSRSSHDYRIAPRLHEARNQSPIYSA